MGASRSAASTRISSQPSVGGGPRSWRTSRRGGLDSPRAADAAARATRDKKQEIDRDVLRLVEARGIVLMRHGADLIGLCPFHDDKEPSLVVSPKKNLWHCLGACQAGGSVIDWVMRAEGVRFRHAVELLRTNTAPTSSKTNKIAKHSTVTKLPPPVEVNAEDQKLLSQVVTFYHRTLEESPEALDYLK